MKFTNLLLVTVIVVLGFTSCVSLNFQEEALPEFPYFEGASLYTHIRDDAIISFIAKDISEQSERLVSQIDKLSFSVFNDSVVVAVELSNPSLFKKQKILQSAKAKQIDEDGRYWNIAFNDKQVLIDAGYANALVFTVSNGENISADLQKLRSRKLMKSMPQAIKALEVSSSDAFWIWSDVNFFKNYLNAILIEEGSGALRIPQYDGDEDMRTSIALPYVGSRSDFATLKLTLPFLFKSIDANILGSLPDVNFTNGLVTIEGLQLPPKTIDLFLNVVEKFSLFR